MRIHELLPLCLDGAREVIDVSDEAADLMSHLRPPAGVRCEKVAPDQATDHGTGVIIVALLGPTPPAYEEPRRIAPVLRGMRPGARAVLLLGWPIEELPYHRLIGPLVEASCQVLEAVPVERATMYGGVHCALFVECVDKLVPARAYLTDVPTEPGVGWGRPEPGDEPRGTLRLVNEYILADLVARPLRRRLIELGDRERELAGLVRERDAQITKLERSLADTTRRLTVLQDSTAVHLGRAVVDSVRHPGRAAVQLPRDLVRVWRRRRAR